MASLSAQLADRLLDAGLVEFIESRRSAGESWNTIAFALSTEFGILISHETVRRWADDLPVAVDPAACTAQLPLFDTDRTAA
jgi:hypothetical protein